MALRAALLRGAGATRGAAAPPGVSAPPHAAALAAWRRGTSARLATTRSRNRRDAMDEDDYRRTFGSARYSDSEEDGYGAGPGASWAPELEMLPPDAEPEAPSRGRRGRRERPRSGVAASIPSAAEAGRLSAPAARPPPPPSPQPPPRPRAGSRRGATFLGSSSTVDQCPVPTLPEFALVGRSNAGKSSLVNALTGRRDLAAVSKTPGKTRLINHFEVDGAWRLVDLPGYGFARASKSDTLGWSEMTSEFIQARQGLARVLLLVDASIPPTRIDVAAAEFLSAAPAWAIVFTKADKRKKRLPKPRENVDEFMHTLRAMGVEPPPSFLTSAKDGGGVHDLLRAFKEWTADWNREQAAGGA